MDDVVHVKLYYGVANRVDLYVKNQIVPPLAKISFENPDGPDLSRRGTLLNQPHGATINRLTGYMEFVFWALSLFFFVIKYYGVRSDYCNRR